MGRNLLSISAEMFALYSTALLTSLARFCFARLVCSSRGYYYVLTVHFPTPNTPPCSLVYIVQFFALHSTSQIISVAGRVCSLVVVMMVFGGVCVVVSAYHFHCKRCANRTSCTD